MNYGLDKGIVRWIVLPSKRDFNRLASNFAGKNLWLPVDSKLAMT